MVGLILIGQGAKAHTTGDNGYDVGWGMLTGAIKYKLEEGGGIFVEVPTKKVAPSQTCPKCGNREKKEREERVHSCQRCGYVQDRDLAAAEVMVLWVRNALPHAAWNRIPGGMRELKVFYRGQELSSQTSMPPALLLRLKCISVADLCSNWGKRSVQNLYLLTGM